LDRLRPQPQPHPAPPGAPPPETRPADPLESAAVPPAEKEPALVLVIVGIVTAIAGVALFFAIFPSLVAYVRDPAGLVLNAPFVVYRVILLVVGLGMALGGALGTWQALNPSSAIFSDEDLRGRGKERYKSIDDMVDGGIYIGTGRRDRYGRRRGRRYRLW
jgi:hypothetical protein